MSIRSGLGGLPGQGCLVLVLLYGQPLWAQAADAGTAVAADTTVTAPAEVLEEVVTRGRRLSEIEFDIRVYIQDFVKQVAAPAIGRGYARWNRSVCVGVHNLENQYAQFIIDRIAGLGLSLGLEPGEPGCAPQVNIVFSTDARQTAAGLVEQAPRVFRPVGGDAGTGLGLEGLDKFVDNDLPVRWWHVSLPVDARTGAAAIETPGAGCPQLHCYPTIAVDGPSRLHSGIRDDLTQVIIIVDVSQLPGTSWQQIGDYLGMVALAQVDLDADPAEYDSILNLFSNPRAYSGLTDWDEEYMRALYQFEQERDPRLQRNEMVSRIARQEAAAAEADAARAAAGNGD